MMMSEDGKKPRVYRVQKTRRSVWKDEEVYKVISVWKKRILELRQTKKNKHIYAEIAEELNEMGMDTICEEVHTKIQNLSQLYRSEKRRIEQNGGPPSEWPYYTAVEDVLLSVEGFDRPQDENSMKFHASDVVSVNDSGSDSDSDTDEYHQQAGNNGNHNGDDNYMTDYFSNNQHTNRKSFEFNQDYASASASVASSSQSTSTSRTDHKSSTNTSTIQKKQHLPTEANLQLEILNEIKRANALADLEREETNFLHREMKELEQQRFNLTKMFMDKSLSLQREMLRFLKTNNDTNGQQREPSPGFAVKRKRPIE